MSRSLALARVAWHDPMSRRGDSIDTESIKERVAKTRWFHTIDLGNGIVTAGIDDSPRKLKFVRMPADLSGMSVLDIGAYDGFFSFEAERRGASRVVALDYPAWVTPMFGGKPAFDLAREALHSKVESMEMDVLDVSPTTTGVFDLVLFLGVLYHLRHPLLALERIFRVTKGQLILETHVDKVRDKRPVMVFYPGRELNGDPSNWWGPNPPAVESMLKDVGFGRVRKVAQLDGFWRRAGRALKRKVTKRVPLTHTLGQTRAVFHAWK